MGRIDPKLIVQGEESSIKVVKFKGKAGEKSIDLPSIPESN